MWCYCQYKVSGINPFCCNIIIANTVRRIKNMKWKHLAIMFTAILLLFGCSSYNNKNTDESRGTTDKTNEKTRYNEDGKLERNNRNITRKTRENTNINDKVSEHYLNSNNRHSNNSEENKDVQT